MAQGTAQLSLVNGKMSRRRSAKRAMPTQASILRRMQASGAGAESDGPGLADAAVALLRELLFRFATRRAIPAAVEVLRVDPSGVEAVVRSGRYDPERHVEGEDVKAAVGRQFDERACPQNRGSGCIHAAHSPIRCDEEDGAAVGHPGKPLIEKGGRQPDRFLAEYEQITRLVADLEVACRRLAAEQPGSRHGRSLGLGDG